MELENCPNKWRGILRGHKRAGVGKNYGFAGSLTPGDGANFRHFMSNSIASNIGMRNNAIELLNLGSRMTFLGSI